MWQGILAGLIVLAATLYAGWTLMPGALRLRLARAFGAWARRPGLPAWLGRGATKLESRAARRHAGACSDCSAVQASPTRPGRTTDS